MANLTVRANTYIHPRLPMTEGTALSRLQSTHPFDLKDIEKVYLEGKEHPKIVALRIRSLGCVQPEYVVLNITLARFEEWLRSTYRIKDGVRVQYPSTWQKE